MRLQIYCKNCGKLTYNRGHGLCQTCYTRWHYITFKDKIEEVRKKWWPKYYQKNKERMNRYATQYHKRDYVKKKKAEYDKKRRNLIRFDGNRERALKRANYQCEMCGEKKDLHVHHIDGKSYYNGIPNNKLNNLMVVCRNCHYNKVHKIHGPHKEITKQKIGEKKRQRDIMIRRIKNPSILPDGEIRQCELCGLNSKYNSVINAIALNDQLDFLPQYREAHKLSIEEKKRLSQGIHFICLNLNRCHRAQNRTPHRITFL